MHPQFRSGYGALGQSSKENAGSQRIQRGMLNFVFLSSLLKTLLFAKIENLEALYTFFSPTR